MPRTVALAAAVTLLLGSACGGSSGAPPAPRKSPVAQGPATTPPAVACSTVGLRVLQLGGHVGAQLSGNDAPVRATVRIGTSFVVRAQFASRAVSNPTSHDLAVRALCTTLDGHDPGAARSTVFRAQQSGTALIQSATADCPPCIALAFDASITVTQ